MTSTAGERKVVTVLFTDVTGSTQLADRLDVEELRDVMSEWFAAMRGEIEAQGGTVEKYIGDAVMAVFGVPNAHEDDPARALRAALAMRRAAGRAERAASSDDGITHGDPDRDQHRRGGRDARPPPGEAIVIGAAVNVAARLEQSPSPG